MEKNYNSLVSSSLSILFNLFLSNFTLEHDYAFSIEPILVLI